MEEVMFLSFENGTPKINEEVVFADFKGGIPEINEDAMFVESKNGMVSINPDVEETIMIVEQLAKKIKDSFLDVSKKFQVNYAKHNPTEITIEKSKQEKWKQRIEIKEELDVSKLSEIEKWWIL